MASTWTSFTFTYPDGLGKAGHTAAPLWTEPPNIWGLHPFPPLCITALASNKMSFVNDSARLVMSSGQLALFLKRLFNPISETKSL